MKNIFFILLCINIVACNSDPSEEVAAEEQYLEDYRSNNFKWGFMNLQGEVVINKEIDEAGYFKKGLAPVRYNALWGYIDRKGRYQIQPQFRNASSFNDEGFAKVMWLDGQSGVINLEGDTILHPTSLEIILSGDTAVIKKEKEYSIYNLKSGEITHLKGDIKISGKQYFNLTNSTLLNNQNKELAKGVIEYKLCNSNPVVRTNKEEHIFIRDDSEYYISAFPVACQKNHLIIPCEAKMCLFNLKQKAITLTADYLQFLSEDRLALLKDGRFYLLDTEGTKVDNKSYKDLGPFNYGLASASFDGRLYGFINKMGEMVIPPRAVLNQPCRPEGCWTYEVISDLEVKMSLYDTLGYLKIRADVLEVRPFHEGLAAVRLE